VSDLLPGFEKVKVIDVAAGFDTPANNGRATQPAGGEVIPWLGNVRGGGEVAGGPEVSAFSLLREWSAAFQEWAAGLESNHTRAAYLAAWRDFLTYAGGIAWKFEHFPTEEWFGEFMRACNRGPWEVDGGDVNRWANHMKAERPYSGEVVGNGRAGARGKTVHHPGCAAAGRIPVERTVRFGSAVEAVEAGWGYCSKCKRQLKEGAGLSDATRQLRLAAISAFYGFACRREIYIAGRRLPLSNFNPVLNVPRPNQIKRVRQIKYLSRAQVDAFMNAIERNTVEGLRNYALFYFYVSTGRRNREVRTLRKRDFREAGEKLQYFWRGKRSEGWDTVPEGVLEAMRAYLKAAGRAWESLDEDDFIFVSLSDCANRFPGQEGWKPGKNAISGRQVGELLHIYVRRAGIQVEGLTVHSLRHTLSMALFEKTKDVRRVQKRLGHKSVATTEKYLHDLEGASDADWEELGEMFKFTDRG